MNRFRAALGDSEEDEEDDSEDSKSEDESDVQPSAKQKVPEKQQNKKQKVDIGLEDLKNAGFHSGPSILTIKEQPQEQSYAWYIFAIQSLCDQSTSASCLIATNAMSWSKQHLLTGPASFGHPQVAQAGASYHEAIHLIDKKHIFGILSSALPWLDTLQVLMCVKSRESTGQDAEYMLSIDEMYRLVIRGTGLKQVAI